MPDSNIFVVVRHRIGGQDYGRCRWIAPGLTGRETARGLRGQWSVRPIHIPAPSVHSAPRITRSHTRPLRVLPTLLRSDCGFECHVGRSRCFAPSLARKPLQSRRAIKKTQY